MIADVQCQMTSKRFELELEKGRVVPSVEFFNQFHVVYPQDIFHLETSGLVPAYFKTQILPGLNVDIVIQVLWK